MADDNFLSGKNKIKMPFKFISVRKTFYENWKRAVGQT
jgi:hypothetical protein